MNTMPESIKKDYIMRVDNYLKNSDSNSLHAIEKVGKTMVKAGVSFEDISEFHLDSVALLIEKHKLNNKQASALTLTLMRLLVIYGEHYRTKKEHKATEHRLQLAWHALDSTEQGVMITDSNGEIIDINASFSRITGYSREEIIGNNSSMLQSDRQDASFYRKMWKQLKIKGHWESVIWNRNKRGEIYSERLTIDAMYDKKGKMCNFIGIFSDCSEQLALESRLRQSQKLEAIGTLVGGIAHDFNNTLAGIQGNVYLALCYENIEPGLKQRLEVIDRLSQRSATIVSQLLTFARKANVDKKRLSLLPLIKETRALARVGIVESIELELHDDGHPCELVADFSQIQQMILNLINNAKDAVENVSNPLIRIQLRHMRTDRRFLSKYKDAKKGDYCHLQIEDNGCGIAPEYLSKVFDPFFTTKEVGKGTGLGLAMAFGTVKTHHGIIDVDSKKGKGTCFHIYLPLHTELKQAMLPTPKDDLLKGKGETLLLVDDEPMVRQVMHDILIMLGYQVLLAESGEQALSIFTEHADTVRLVISDVVMPNMSGGQLSSQLLLRKPELPIIFTSGYNLKQLGKKNVIIKGYPILIKPVKIDVLAMNVRELLDRCPPQKQKSLLSYNAG